MALSPTSCPSCNTPNRAGSAFCNKCGSSLTGGGSPSGSTGRIASGHVLKQRYRIIQIVGQGGMGAVYKGEDIQFGNRLVAVKEMRQTGLDPQELKEAADAFKQEAVLLAGLKHPNLPSIYDHFEEKGRWYLVMDFIEGETLAEHLNKTKEKVLPVPEVLDVGIQLSKVLGYLHTRPTPIIFRDLKPSNVMLTPEGNVYLIDFGIARFFKPGQAKDTAAYGSAGYSSPEQYGKAQTTPQSDIYSFGATLHEMLSGIDPSNTPFRFAPLPSRGQPALTELAALITRMLDMDAQRRPASMAAVKQELERIADKQRHPPVPPPVPPTVPVPPPPPVPQNKGVLWRVVVFGLIGLVVVGGIALAASHTSSPTPQTSFPTSVSTPEQTSFPATATTGASTASATWLVTFDNSENGTQLTNGYQVNDPVNHHYILVHFTFTNNTSQAQELQTEQDIYLQGSDGQRYSEAHGSNPSNVLQFAPGETQHVYTAYVVPDSVCNYTLVVANPGGQDLTWPITVTDSNYCHT
jgi:serine/threonine protein kinase